MILLSIIVPVYNVENYLSQCIESILAQNFKAYELILIDDGSTDTSGVICDRYSEQDHRIRVIHQENMGLAMSRNCGLDIARGEYIAFVDSDDWVASDMYEHLFDMLKRNEADMAICGYKKEYNDQNPGAIFLHSQEYVMNSAKAIESILTGRPFGAYVWNKIFKKSLLNDHPVKKAADQLCSENLSLEHLAENEKDINSYIQGTPLRFLNIRFAEDVWFTWILLHRAKKIVYNPTSRYFYRQRSDSLCRENFNAHKFNEAVIRKLIYILTSKNYPALQGLAFSRYMQCIIQTSLAIVNNKSYRLQFSQLNKLMSTNKKRIYANKFLNHRFKKHLFFLLLPAPCRDLIYFVRGQFKAFSGFWRMS